MAQWLDTAWLEFDYRILQAIHNFAVMMGGENGFFTWFMRFISFLGEGGWALLAMGAALCLFRKTRRAGLCVLAAIICGSLITNVTLKNLVARTRPFRREDVQAFADWWQYIGSTHAGKRSFPSGHTTSAVAAMTALFLTLPKKYSWTAFLFAFLTALSRMYLVVHYPTDILGGILAGLTAAIVGYFLVKWLSKTLQQHENIPAVRLLLQFDLIEIIRGRRQGKKHETLETVCENEQEMPADTTVGEEPPQGEA